MVPAIEHLKLESSMLLKENRYKIRPTALKRTVNDLMQGKTDKTFNM